jgi:hypothetical protein
MSTTAAGTGRRRRELTLSTLSVPGVVFLERLDREGLLASLEDTGGGGARRGHRGEQRDLVLVGGPADVGAVGPRPASTGGVDP